MISDENITRPITGTRRIHNGAIERVNSGPLAHVPSDNAGQPYTMMQTTVLHTADEAWHKAKVMLGSDLWGHAFTLWAPLLDPWGGKPSRVVFCARNGDSSAEGYIKTARSMKVFINKPNIDDLFTSAWRAMQAKDELNDLLDISKRIWIFEPIPSWDVDAWVGYWRGVQQRVADQRGPYGAKA